MENEERMEFAVLIEIGSTRMEWKLGRIFLLKYQMIFDDDNSLIGFYNHIEKKEINTNKNIYVSIVKYFILGFAIIIIVFLAFIIYKKINILNTRKKLANELEDDFMYIVGRNSNKK